MKKILTKSLKFTIPLIIGLSLTAFSNELEIQKFIDEYDKSNSIILEEISVSASKIPMELSKTGSSVEIVSRKDIENSNEIFLIDYLKYSHLQKANQTYHPSHHLLHHQS